MNILINGGAGFIGSALICHVLRDTAESVVNVGTLTDAGNLNASNEIAGDERYRFERTDICDRAELDRVFLLQAPDAVTDILDNDSRCAIDASEIKNAWCQRVQYGIYQRERLGACGKIGEAV